ncbi:MULTISPECIES: hypothetical protein [unclassified Nonomuraea]|uniref:hypothetical protein n=1 Tax=unclassified Nonomuraea TaxID=2593643 RepID=UPI0035BF6A51
MTHDPVDRRSLSRRTVLATMGALPVLAATPPAVEPGATVIASPWNPPPTWSRPSYEAAEVQGASTADGADIVQYDDWDGANQQGQLVRVG